MAFKPEPNFRHGQQPATAILLCNLGTPEAPTPKALRKYLAEFLSDPRVVEIPRLVWWLILHGIILRLRPAKSAAKYASIWTHEGSPLRAWTSKQAAALQDWLDGHGHHVTVHYAMRYGLPSIAAQLDALKAEGVNRILILPAYPQYSGTTSASVFDSVYQWAGQIRHIPEFRFINRYHDDAGYIDALVMRIRNHWQEFGRPDQLVMSFHGVPERTLHLGDPYHCECQKTARLLAQALGLEADQYKLTFQSRFGKAKWLQPYTEPSLIQMAKSGVKRVDVVCPGFTSDCLETLEEIAQEVRQSFMLAGGKEFHYIACLNDDSEWIAALGEIAQRHLAGWPTIHTPHTGELAASRQAAIALGAKN
jgi:protoporphyrin/coproporphyrin ferrochelatase